MSLTTEFLFEGEGSRKTMTVNRVQDVEDIIERNKRLQTETQRSDWGRHIGEIPNVILERWLNEEYERGNVGLRLHSKEFDAIIKRKLRSSEWAWLRTTDKRF